MRNGAWFGLLTLALGSLAPACDKKTDRAHPPDAKGESLVEADAGSAVAHAHSASDTATPDEEQPDFPPPRGDHIRSSCRETRAVVAHADRLLAFEPRAPKDADFARELIDWLDPYGHWSAAKGAGLTPLLKKRAGALLSELLAYGAVSLDPPQAGQRVTSLDPHSTANGRGKETLALGECPVGDELGKALESELRTLDAEFERGRHAAKLPTAAVALGALPGAVTAKEFALELGSRFAAIEHLQDATLSQALAAGKPRLFPHYDSAEAWGGVVRTAAIRAYVRLIDAHGGWAPRDEALSIYDLDLLDMGPLVLWQHAEASLVGPIVRDGALPPLQQGDIVLKVDDLWTASLPPEQIDEISIAALSGKDEATVTIYRDGQVQKLTASAPKTLDTTDFPSALELEFLPYGAGRVAVIRIHDVYDYLGSDLGQTLAELRKQTDIAGLLLDLRDNGGGAMDGALDALAYFLPARPMFPMQNRTRTTEVDLTRNVPAADVWQGPLAALVDGGTASAAEMLAGALAAYGRASVVGSRTFGKGCIQEYVDDEAKLGVFRITTSLYALPDGTPVQRTGLLPDIPIAPRAGINPALAEREAQLGAVGPSWRGPDVRTSPLPQQIQWPKADGPIGPCDDALACRALTALSRDRRVARVKPLPTASLEKPSERR